MFSADLLTCQKAVMIMNNRIAMGKYADHTAFIDCENAFNGNMTFFGKPGSGKTVLAQKILLQTAENGRTSVAISLNDTLADEEIYPLIKGEFKGNTHKIDAYKKGIEIPLFDPLGNEDSEKHRIDTIGSITDVFSNAYRFGSRQSATFRKAVAEVYDDGTYKHKGISAIGECLASMKSDVAQNLYDKTYMVTQHNIFMDGNNLIQPGKINIIALDKFDSATQRSAAEILISYIWRMATHGEFRKTGLYVFIDEAQNLDISENSTMGKMMREGRKFGLKLMLATQFVEKATYVSKLMNQADLQIFFQPGRSTIREAANTIDPTNPDVWIGLLKELKVGEFIAVGPLICNGKRTGGPLKIDSRDENESNKKPFDSMDGDDVSKVACEDMAFSTSKQSRQKIKIKLRQ